MLLRAVARGDVAVVPLKDEDLERSIKTMLRVYQTLSRIEPDLASPLYRIYTALTRCRRLRKEYRESSRNYRTEIPED